MKRYLTFLITVLATMFLAACGGGGGSAGTTPNDQALFTTAPSDLTMDIGAAQEYTVGGGRGPYTAVSSNSSIVVPAVQGNVLTLGAVKPGSSTVTLRDSRGATANVTVNVQPSTAFFTTAPTQLSVAIGSTTTFTVGGGVAPYTATTNNANIVRAALSGNSLSIIGVAGGSGSIVLRDAAGTSITVAVTVEAKALFTSAPAALTIGIGSPNARTFTVGGGVGPYTVTSTNENVATATLSGSTLTIRGVSTGSATIQIRDSANTLVSVGVTVRLEQLLLNPTAFNAFIGDVLYSVISGGRPPYQTISGFPDAAEATVGTLDSASGAFTVDPNGNILRVRVKQAVASGSIIVRDAAGNTANLTVTATAATNQISFSPNAVTVSQRAGTVPLVLYGAIGTVNLFSSDPKVASVTSPVEGSSTGTLVTVTIDCALSAGQQVTITAVDSTGAVAKSILNIQASVGGCAP